MSAQVSASVAIYRPEPGDMSLYPNDKGGLVLVVADSVWFTLGDSRFTEGPQGLATEAAAMRKLAELATKAAAELERRAGGAR